MPAAKREKKTTVTKRVSAKTNSVRATVSKSPKNTKILKSRSVAAAPKRRPATKSTARPKAEAYGNRTFSRTSSPHAGVSITVQIPPLRRPRQPGKDGDVRPSLLRHLLRPAIITALLLVVGTAIVFGPGAKSHKAPAKPVAAAERTEPDYKPLIPSAEKASTTKFDAKRNLVTYTTTFSGARITVSQQPLPAGFTKDPDALKKAADSIKATQQIETDKGVLQVATNTDAGDQLAIFADSKVLVFIHSEGKLDDASWKSFIELLQAKAWKELT